MSRKYLLCVVALIVVLNSMAAIGAPAFAYTMQRAAAQAYANTRSRATASDYVVNSLDDGNVGSCTPAHCSLRDAITLANTDAGAATTTFAVSGTIVLANSLPSISGTLTIDGGSAITVSGASAYQVMRVNGGAALTLNALTIANGSSDFGGGIRNEGALTVTNSTFSGNSAVYGGGLYNEFGGMAVISNTTFSSNPLVWPCPCLGGGEGGGIRNNGTLAVTNSTFSGNGTMWSGYYTAGGGVFNAGTLTVTSSTFDGNEAPRGGGIVNFGTITVQNTIIANSFGGNCNGSVTVTDGGNNLDSDGSCGWGSGNGSLSHVDPRLGPLADNGGATLTMMLLPDSPAIDAVTFNAPNECPATDQRGVARPIGPRCDIGAFEANITRHAFLPIVAKNVVSLPDVIIKRVIERSGWRSAPPERADRADKVRGVQDVIGKCADLIVQWCND